ncbi:hypothetical protein DIZ81_04435 [Legionella taurinensis]|uniref:Uncharacterized protein n=1 Tax=Legionella taurinensis TaxID=70611 RepID=A0AB38N7Q8_9GAMM|nr:hypothetical protein [Legionella taurinensis]MDX1836917.1 hypothetical protein [Legionella taurinensis]PUT41327.1 hypothetical protein DB744_04435 [Legionella taurinensis]PUT42565.1 hypothetical protein DB746_06770 [Legionella taurinensis]PUT46593.1 hypothetical protein DB743_04170 [Legionella taurinensis]PUT47243.1 hypothetical protein DB745_07850 [Legionella taurinensis]
MIYRFFKTKDVYTETQLNELSAALIKKFRDRFSAKALDLFFPLLTIRTTAFDYHIDNTIPPAEKQLFINAKYAFLKCLDDCLAEYDKVKKEQREEWVEIYDFVSHYYTSPHYLRVGGNQGEHTINAFDQAATGFMILSGVILAAGLVAFAFNFPIALLLTAVALTIMAPSLFYTVAETHGHEAVVNKQEEILFSALNGMVNHQELSDEELHPYVESTFSV